MRLSLCWNCVPPWYWCVLAVCWCCCYNVWNTFGSFSILKNELPFSSGLRSANVSAHSLVLLCRQVGSARDRLHVHCTVIFIFVLECFYLSTTACNVWQSIYVLIDWKMLTTRKLGGKPMYMHESLFVHMYMYVYKYASKYEESLNICVFRCASTALLPQNYFEKLLSEKRLYRLCIQIGPHSHTPYHILHTTPTAFSYAPFTYMYVCMCMRTYNASVCVLVQVEFHLSVFNFEKLNFHLVLIL